MNIKISAQEPSYIVDNYRIIVDNLYRRHCAADSACNETLTSWKIEWWFIGAYLSIIFLILCPSTFQLKSFEEKSLY